VIMENEGSSKVCESQKENLILATEQEVADQSISSVALGFVGKCSAGDSDYLPRNSQTYLPPSESLESTSATEDIVEQRSSNGVRGIDGLKVISSGDSIDVVSSKEASCINSVLLENSKDGTSSRPISPLNVDFVVAEYDKLKERHQSLQSEYQTLLGREKVLCEKLKDYRGKDDATCNALTNLNAELRKELDFVLCELQKLRNENRKLQEKENAGLGHLDKIEDIVKLEEVVSELEAECKKVQEERDAIKEKLGAHDIAAKRAITALQKELSTRVEQLGLANDGLIKEKDVMLLKVTKCEEVIAQNEKKIEILERKLAENKKEIERWKAMSKQKEVEHIKLQAVLQEKDEEHTILKSEVEKAIEDSSSQTVKAKWSQNKLIQELEAHKETKVKLAQANSKIEEMKEEGEQIRLACQEMIKKYQSSEEMRSVQLDKALKELENSMKVKEHEVTVQSEINSKKSQELEAIKSEHRKALSEISNLKTMVSMLEGKLSNYTIKNGEMERRISTLSRKEEELVLTDKLLNDANQDLKGYKEQILYYVQLEEDLRKQLVDFETDSRECRQKEAELLSYTEKLTENNAHWKSKACDLQSRLEYAEAEIVELQQMLEKSNVANRNQDANAKREKEELQSTLEDYLNKIEQKQKLVEALTLNLEEAQDEVKVQKRKSVSTIKDLQRQLHQAKKRLDQLEECVSSSQDGATLKSRASSNSSLDRLSNDSGAQVPVTPTLNGTNISNQALHGINHPSYDGEYSVVQPGKTKTYTGEIEVDKAVLVDRICRLQRAHAKKNEKLEFLEEHNRSLIEEIKKKNKILQYYVLREESGTLISSKVDRNKVEISRKGGIMASIYSSRVSDKDMTLDLSLEINRKLQAVVEDTLLKNITLKESVNTLGAEIARLQEEMKNSRK